MSLLLYLSAFVVPPTFPHMVGLVFLVAFLYASVGFGGASGYLAVMSFFDIPAAIAASTALSLNVIVSGIAFFNYTRFGHLQVKLLWPFLIGSIPAAFIGGTLQVSQIIYQILLNLVLLFVALRLLWGNSRNTLEGGVTPPSWIVALLSGVILGLLSGVLGVGGGIFLSPLILITGWGLPKHAAASSSGFIFTNSIAALAGRAWGGTLHFGEFGPILIVFGIMGGLAGSYLGARFYSGQMIHRLLGVILLIAVARFLFVWLGT